MGPKVTLAMPTRNRVHYLATSLESALGQTLRDLEVVVSDNRCTDGTAEFLSTIGDPRVRVLTQTEDLSMVENWNRCVAAAQGTYFLLLSDDDVLEPRALEAMVAAFETDSDPDSVGFVYCRGRIIDAKGTVVRPGFRAPPQEDAAQLIVAFFKGERETWPCSILLRRTDLAEGYSDAFLVITDAAVWVQAVCRRGRAKFVDEELVNYRVHANLSAATPIQVWRQENLRLKNLALNALRQAGQLTPAVERDITDEVERLNLRIVLTLPLNAKERSRSTVLRTYWQHLPEFASWYGAKLMVPGFAAVALPARIVRTVRKLKRKWSSVNDVSEKE